MSDLIDRQATIDALCNDYCGGHQDCKYYPNCENLRSVQKLHSAQPAEPKRGKWISADAMFHGVPFYCSECGENTRDTVMGKPRWKFCPMCGAKMEGADDE